MLGRAALDRTPAFGAGMLRGVLRRVGVEDAIGIVAHPDHAIRAGLALEGLGAQVDEVLIVANDTLYPWILREDTKPLAISHAAVRGRALPGLSGRRRGRHEKGRNHAGGGRGRAAEPFESNHAPGSHAIFG